jgi:hypothetical protein
LVGVEPSLANVPTGTRLNTHGCISLYKQTIFHFQNLRSTREHTKKALYYHGRSIFQINLVSQSSRKSSVRTAKNLAGMFFLNKRPSSNSHTTNALERYGCSQCLLVQFDC